MIICPAKSCCAGTSSSARGIAGHDVIQNKSRYASRLCNLSDFLDWRVRTQQMCPQRLLCRVAKRLQLWMWLLCAWRPSLRAAISSIIRWRSGLTVVSVLMGSFS